LASQSPPLWARGCARTISRDQLFQIRHEGDAETVNSWRYCGSDERFAYFSNMRILRERLVRVPRDQLKLRREFSYTHDRERWVQAPLGVTVPRSPRFDPDFFAPDRSTSSTAVDVTVHSCTPDVEKNLARARE